MRKPEQIRQRLVERLHFMLSRSGMMASCESDLEVQIRTLIADLQFIDEIEINEERPIINELVQAGIYYPANVINGVSNIFRNLIPDMDRYMEYISSVYAREANKAGYLKLDNILSQHKFDELVQRILAGEFSHGYDKEQLLQRLPEPSYIVSRTVLCYATSDEGLGWIYFDLPVSYDEDKGYQDILMSIRWPSKSFEDGFQLTKEGYARTKRGVAAPTLDIENIMEQWQVGWKWNLKESLPTVQEEPRESLWKHLW